MRKRRREDPLESSVNDVVRRICAWEDACGGRFTVDTETLVGDDFVELRVRGVDEVRLLDVVEVVEKVPHIVDYGCYFATQCLWFKFETGDDSKKKRIAPDEDSKRETEEALEEEYQRLRPRLKTETDEDTRDVCRLVIAMKSVVPALHAKGVRVDLTPTPGVIVVNFKGLPRLDMPMIRQLRSLGGGAENNVRVDAVVFLSPKETQCVRVCVKKSRNTVNI